MPPAVLAWVDHGCDCDGLPRQSQPSDPEERLLLRRRRAPKHSHMLAKLPCHCSEIPCTIRIYLKLKALAVLGCGGPRSPPLSNLESGVRTTVTLCVDMERSLLDEAVPMYEQALRVHVRTRLHDAALLRYRFGALYCQAEPCWVLSGPVGRLPVTCQLRTTPSFVGICIGEASRAVGGD